ncbi:MAG: hypothetical protein N3B18_02725, partial [Desulfobacterota bacterium]|nr:hypothetical protein [Thermodesulfobacteriota bacterium]
GRQTDALLETLYGCGEQGPAGYTVVVRTKWHKLALLASRKALAGNAISEREQAVILEDPLLQIDVRVYGTSLNFAEDYTIMLKQHGREIKPEKLHADHFQLPAHYPKVAGSFQAYTATIRAYFNYAQLDPDAASILVIKNKNREHAVPLNLKVFK